MADLDISTVEGVLRLTLNRPERLNALTAEMADRLAHELEQATTYDDVRVVVIAGAAGAFCAGADIGDADAHPDLDVTALDRANRIIRAVVRLDKPVVALVDGVAAGVGCSIALACDVVVASDSAQFLLAFARIGLMPDGGSSALVAASVGRARAMRMGLLADPMTAQEARAAGLVSHVAPAEDFETAAAGVVRRLAAGPPLALTATKRAINAATLGALEDALERERTGQTVLLRTADAAEGMRAFTEKRPPVFRGA